MDKQLRSNNIEIFSPFENENESDLENITNILADLNKNNSNFTFFRLGRTESPIPDEQRPIFLQIKE